MVNHRTAQEMEMSSYSFAAAAAAAAEVERFLPAQTLPARKDTSAWLYAKDRNSSPSTGAFLHGALICVRNKVAKFPTMLPPRQTCNDTETRMLLTMPYLIYTGKLCDMIREEWCTILPHFDKCTFVSSI